MGRVSTIGYCDSTLNLQAGCDGCELLEHKTQTCYAYHIVKRYNESGHAQGHFPADFSKPEIYPHRIENIRQWSDLTYKDRASSPWLNRYPRVIFLNDMGDGFTKELDLMWMSEFIPQMEATPHIYLMLTKRIVRMSEFWKQYGAVPDNIWLGTSVTTPGTMNRIDGLLNIPAKTRWVSAEPMLRGLDFMPYTASGDLSWVVVGGESGKDSRPFPENSARQVRDACMAYGVSFFMKQLGGSKNKRADLKDIPKDLRIRQLPEWESLEWKGKAPKQDIQISLI